MADVSASGRPPATDGGRPPARRGEASGDGAPGDARTGGDRAQLIIVTGLAIGVTLIALVVILNTVIYTENLATRSAGVGGAKAVEYRSTAVETTGAAMDHENREDYPTWTRARANVTHGVSRVDRFLRLQYVEGETAAEVTNLSADQGVLVRQTNFGRNFSSSNNQSDWDLVQDVDEHNLRAFELVVDRSAMDPAASDPSTAFNLTLDEELDDELGIELWVLSVYTDGSGDVVLAVHNGSQPGATTGICGSPYGTSTVDIDLTAGTVNGDDCNAIQFARGLDADYQVEFGRGDRAGGGYNLTVNTTSPDPALPITGSLAGAPGGPLPYAVPAAYSLRFDVHYQQPRLTYHDRVRVAPGEPK